MANVSNSVGSALSSAASMNPFGAIAGMASNAIGSLIQGSMQRKMMREQNDFNAREAQKNRDFQVSMWRKNNDYNTPLAQRQRLEDAGYNPFMQDVQSGNATSSPTGAPASSSGLPTAQFTFGNSLDAYFEQKRQANLQQQLQKNQFAFDTPMNTKLLEQLGEIINGLKIDNNNKPFYNRLQNDYLDAMRAFTDTQRHSMYLEQSLRLPKEIANIIADTDLKVAQNALNQLDAQQKEILLKYMDEQQLASIGVLLSQGRLADAQSALASTENKIKQEDYKRWKATTDDWIKRTNAESQYWSGYYGNFPEYHDALFRGNRDYNLRYDTDYSKYIDSKYPLIRLQSGLGAYRYGLAGSGVQFVGNMQRPSQKDDYNDWRSWKNYTDYMNYK